jgi:16S rRNA (uracil1498-N3)-methyltransferase
MPTITTSGRRKPATMNIILLRESDWTGGQSVRLSDYRAQHIINVIQPALGQSLRVGLINGDKGMGTVTAIDPTTVQLEVALTEAPPARHPTRLVLALPRPKMLRRILRTVAEFGVDELHLIHSYRVEKSFWQSPYLEKSKVDAALIQGLERAGDTVLPLVTEHRRFKPFMEDSLLSIAAERNLVMAHPSGEHRLQTEDGKERCLLVGPEGGFIDYEVELAQSLGATVAHLGHRIMSVDTAVCAALARDLY